MRALKPLLDRFGNESGLTVILFTLDETSYARELAPLAGHYPILKLGPAWWFYDSPEGMRRFREQTTETAGFYNTVGFNDDTRAFMSIPARHDVARRVDCPFLARLVAEHQLGEDEAFELAPELAYRTRESARTSSESTLPASIVRTELPCSSARDICRVTSLALARIDPDRHRPVVDECDIHRRRRTRRWRHARPSSRASAPTNASNFGRATSGGAAPDHDGRAPFFVDA